MSWMPFVSVAADLGDFIGGIAIVVTLVLLLRQMRQTERITRAQLGHAFSADINAVNLLVAGDQSVPDILRRVAEGEEVTPAEWTRYTFVQLSACRAWEALHAHYRLGLVDAEVWQVQQDTIDSSFAANPAWRRWWRSQPFLFQAEFRALVDQLVNRHEANGTKQDLRTLYTGKKDRAL